MFCKLEKTQKTWISFFENLKNLKDADFICCNLKKLKKYEFIIWKLKKAQNMNLIFFELQSTWI